MRIASNLLLSIAGLIALFLAILVGMMALGNEAAIWLGGWGLLFLGIPIFVIWLTCLFVGLALRPKPEPLPVAETNEKRSGVSFDWIMITVGVLLLGYMVVELAVSHFFVLPGAGDLISGMGRPTPLNNSTFVLFALFDLKIPIALGAIAYGVTQLSKRKQL